MKIIRQILQLKQFWKICACGSCITNHNNIHHTIWSNTVLLCTDYLELDRVQYHRHPQASVLIKYICVRKRIVVFSNSSEVNTPRHVIVYDLIPIYKLYECVPAWTVYLGVHIAVSVYLPIGTHVCWRHDNKRQPWTAFFRYLLCLLQLYDNNINYTFNIINIYNNIIL